MAKPRTRRQPAKRVAKQRENPKLRAALNPPKKMDHDLMILAAVALVTAAALIMIIRGV